MTVSDSECREHTIFPLSLYHRWEFFLKYRTVDTASYLRIERQIIFVVGIAEYHFYLE